MAHIGQEGGPRFGGVDRGLTLLVRLLQLGLHLGQLAAKLDSKVLQVAGFVVAVALGMGRDGRTGCR